MIYSHGVFKLQNSPALREIPIKPPGGGDIMEMFQNKGNRVYEFIEPELAEPKPSYSGLPLESFPNAKIKKESLWPAKTKKLKTRVEPDPVRQEGKEITYKFHLQTSNSDSLTNESRIRSVHSPKGNPKLPDEEATKTETNRSVPLTPISQASGSIKVKTPNTNSPLRASKRIKVITPKKPIATTHLAPSFVTEREKNSSDLEEPSNDDFCSACGGSGVFICCEGCPKSFHFICCDPPLDDLPEDNWICRDCEANQNPKNAQQYDDMGIFGQLMNNLSTLNPVEFQLPKSLRDDTFINVETDEHGTYEDDSLKPQLSYGKLNGSQISGYNYNQDLEIEKLYHKNGDPFLCHKCGLSGLYGKTLVHCDYCPLVWHMDCLKDPIYTPKTVGFKWRCPNHYENLFPVNLFSKRNFKDTPIMDVALHNHFLKIAQSQNFLIKYRDQPWLKKDGSVATLQEYLQYEMKNFNKLNPDYDDKEMSAGNHNTLDNDDDIHEDFNVPNFFNNYPIKGGVVAKPSERLSRIITMTNEDESNGGKVCSFVYRVPEESIVLDFFTKVKTESQKRKRRKKVQHLSVRDRIFRDLDKYEEKRKDEADFLSNAEYFHQTSKNDGIEHLIKAALGSTPEPTTPLSSDEVSELVHIKKLIQAKGKDAFMEFLKS
ncbi:hypothetical protein CANTEDRAFT_124254 [Yamadazyma tenuis ATCC 10573]|uniref:PHD-type domain-containing protein n=1 Tax=Candida tenuis (strain ATCC 10573 / BCRC 21748 / CBS 615 / JCM 9827 / NBRC 10315 / NRRL Y-1498 / VKM Y-70) TaxID=590646 RepID=G3BB68_CANTC|nr:uncharacterized protein CANTEDRAFT_124254 [Yamadazyma tenuis ATCC 10573]EGV61498.1 hypothetical protein CANTEDRAFT_124254 [Yamadazyma tenuis ATCC 10573]